MSDGVVFVTRQSGVVFVRQRGSAIAARAQSQRAPIFLRQSKPFVISSGRPGPRGAAGIDASGIAPPFAFSWGDASPTVVFTAESDGLLDNVSLVVEQAFNGVGAAIKLDVGATPVMATNQNAPSVVSEYSVSPALRMTAGQTVVITITPGLGGSAGSGLVIISFLPIS